MTTAIDPNDDSGAECDQVYGTRRGAIAGTVVGDDALADAIAAMQDDYEDQSEALRAGMSRAIYDATRTYVTRRLECECEEPREVYLAPSSDGWRCTACRTTLADMWEVWR